MTWTFQPLIDQTDILLGSELIPFEIIEEGIALVLEQSGVGVISH